MKDFLSDPAVTFLFGFIVALIGTCIVVALLIDRPKVHRFVKDVDDGCVLLQYMTDDGEEVETPTGWTKIE